MVETKIKEKHIEYVGKLIKEGFSVTIFGDGNIYINKSKSGDKDEDDYLKNNIEEVVSKLSTQIEALRVRCDFAPGDKLPKTVDDLVKMMYDNTLKKSMKAPSEKKEYKYKV